MKSSKPWSTPAMVAVSLLVGIGTALLVGFGTHWLAPDRNPTDLSPGLGGGMAAAVFLTLRKRARDKAGCEGDAPHG